MLLCGAALLFSCKKEDNKKNVIDIEHHYKMVYMLGAAADNHWDSADPLPMKATENPDIFEYELELVRSSENKLLKFCLTVASWDKAEFLVPVATEEGQSFALLKEGVNDLVLTSEARTESATSRTGSSEYRKEAAVSIRLKSILSSLH